MFHMADAMFRKGEAGESGSAVDLERLNHVDVSLGLIGARHPRSKLLCFLAVGGGGAGEAHSPTMVYVQPFFQRFPHSNSYPRLRLIDKTFIKIGFRWSKGSLPVHTSLAILLNQEWCWIASAVSRCSSCGCLDEQLKVEGKVGKQTDRMSSMNHQLCLYHEHVTRFQVCVARAYSCWLVRVKQAYVTMTSDIVFVVIVNEGVSALVVDWQERDGRNMLEVRKTGGVTAHAKFPGSSKYTEPACSCVSVGMGYCF